MPERLTQSDRIARLVTPSLGQDVLVLTGLDGTEAISANYAWNVECLLNEGEDPIDPQHLIGQRCHVELDTPSGARIFPGICTEIRFRGWRSGYTLYELVLRPQLWILTCRTHSRVWSKMSVTDIINSLLLEAGVQNTQRLSKQYKIVDYLVQYQESDYDFISRLMEQHGIFFYFQSDAGGREMLHLGDSQSSLPDIQAYSELRFQAESEIGIHSERLFEWQTHSRLRTSIVELRDWDYFRATPVMALRNAADHPTHALKDQKRMQYPANGTDLSQLAEHANTFADVLVGAERAEAERKFTRGHAPLIHAGGVFQLADHPVATENARHFAIVARHRIEVNQYLSGVESSGDRYYGEYEVADAAKVYRVPLRTPWPRIHGAQTATVVVGGGTGSNSEIAVDEHGRIWVKFHWNDADEHQRSCPVRVAQLWAGNGWGSVWIPRVGMEVVVEFLDGDPNRPLVTGAVYNGRNKPPIKFPEEKTRSTIKSDSSPDGAGFNELRFEDKKDDEEIYIHAERDRLMEIEHDDDIVIGNNQTEKIGGSRTFELTGGDETVTLKGAPGTKDKFGNVITKGGHRTTTLEKGDETLTVQTGKRTTTIKMDDKRTVNTGNDITTIETGNQTNEIKMGNQTTTLGMGNQSTTLKLGNQTTKMNAGKGTVQAMQSYEIKVGGSSIKITPMSIELKAMMIKIDASLMLQEKGGVMAKVQGGAMLTLKGGIVMIN